MANDSKVYGLETLADSVLIPSKNGDLSLEALHTSLFSSGWVSGGIASDAGGETVNVTLAAGMIRVSNSVTADIVYFSADDLSGQSVPTDATRYVVVNYNSGTPILELASSDTSNGYNIIYLAEVHNIGGALTIHNDPRPISDLANRLLLWATNLIGTRVASGEIVSDASPSSRKIAVTAGSVHDRFFRNLITGAFDSNSSDTFTTLYRDGSGDWTRTSAQAEWPNTQYDDGDGGLATMTASYYANVWVIRGFNGDIGVMYGQAEYAAQEDAEAEAAPASRPEEYDEHGFYIAQITFQKSGSSPITITPIKPTLEGTTTIASASTHNNLSGLQGGQAGQYQHLTTAELAAVNTKVMALIVLESDVSVTVADGKSGIPVPVALNGMNITNVRAYVHTKGITGATDIQIRRRRAGSDVDVLSTKVTIGDEFHAADGVINTSNDDLVTGDLLFVDRDAIHSGTSPLGLTVAIDAILP